MYSFAPIVNHGLFEAYLCIILAAALHYVIVSFIGSVFFHENVSIADKNAQKKFEAYLTAYMWVANIALLVSPVFMNFPNPTNTPVIGERVGTQSSIDREQSGKRSIYVENQYIVYKVPEGLVSLKMHPGYAYPERAQLFKN